MSNISTLIWYVVRLPNTAWVYKKGCTRLTATSDKVYQLIAHSRSFSPVTLASSGTTKTHRHDIAEILLKVALNTKNQIKLQWSVVNHIDGVMVSIFHLSVIKTPCLFLVAVHSIKNKPIYKMYLFFNSTYPRTYRLKISIGILKEYLSLR